jgi:hypothetical protein
VIESPAKRIAPRSEPDVATTVEVPTTIAPVLATDAVTMNQTMPEAEVSLGRGRGRID